MSDEIQLGEDEEKAIAEVLRWENEALAKLGSAQLRYTEAVEALKQAESELDRRAAAARHAEAQRCNVMRVIGANLNLPPGIWHFDESTGKLVNTVKKEDRHA